jgi:hypothetical protein
MLAPIWITPFLALVRPQPRRKTCWGLTPRRSSAAVVRQLAGTKDKEQLRPTITEDPGPMLIQDSKTLPSWSSAPSPQTRNGGVLR